MSSHEYKTCKLIKILYGLSQTHKHMLILNNEETQIQSRAERVFSHLVIVWVKGPENGREVKYMHNDTGNKLWIWIIKERRSAKNHHCIHQGLFVYKCKHKECGVMENVRRSIIVWMWGHIYSWARPEMGDLCYSSDSGDRGCLFALVPTLLYCLFPVQESRWIMHGSVYVVPFTGISPWRSSRALVARPLSLFLFFNLEFRFGFGSIQLTYHPFTHMSLNVFLWFKRDSSYIKHKTKRG